MNTSWLDNVRKGIEKRWNNFIEKPTMGKVWSVLVTVFLLWLVWVILNWVMKWTVVQDYIVSPLKRLAEQLGYKPAQ
ncbi:MAG: hypothetical protein ACOYT9_04625 [Patescibacteria group bacterium]